MNKLRFKGMNYRGMLRFARKRDRLSDGEYSLLVHEREPAFEYLEALEAAYNIEERPGYSGTYAHRLRLILPLLREHSRELGLARVGASP